MRYQSTSLNPRTQDLTDREFGRLTVQAFAGYKNSHAWWTCECQCGVIKDYRANSLKRDISQSCGCATRESSANRLRTHGMTGSKIYRIWSSMIGRCHTKTDKKYKFYGARGITVCEAWRRSFKAFLDDMGERPNKDYSLERIDNNGNYEARNCKWATRGEQCRNRRSNVFLTYQGETLCVVDWSQRLGFDSKTIYRRKDLGWTDEEILTRPLRKR